MPRRTDISILIIGASLAVPACARSTAPDAPVANVVQPPSADRHEAELVAAITDRCGLPRDALRLQDDELRLQPPPDARPEAFACLLREVRASGLDAHRLGFVGNEYPGRENVQGR